ncbi:MAG: hypothetical protein JWR27_1163 [Aeromicrobium sp.]|jgi:hypothetical protein|nr:hypothetical protein [Aeromicrobium sp.]
MRVGMTMLLTGVVLVVGGCGGSDKAPDDQKNDKSAATAAGGWQTVTLGALELDVPGSWKSSSKPGADVQVWGRQDHGIATLVATSDDTTSEAELQQARKDAAGNGIEVGEAREIKVGELGTGYRFPITLKNGDVQDQLVLATIDGISVSIQVDDYDESSPSVTADRMFDSLRRPS